MRLIQLSGGWRARCRLVLALVLGACTLLPMNLSAQEAGFLVLRSTKQPKEFYIWVAYCPALKLSKASDDTQKNVNCTFVRKECKPGECEFQKANVPDTMGGVTFGISGTSTCAWVFDWTRFVYIYRCW